MKKWDNLKFYHEDAKHSSFDCSRTFLKSMNEIKVTRNGKFPLFVAMRKHSRLREVISENHQRQDIRLTSFVKKSICEKIKCF